MIRKEREHPLIKKRIFTIIASIALTLLLIYRIVILATDTSGYYAISSLKMTGALPLELLPEISIILTMIGLFIKNEHGLVMNVMALVLAILSFFLEGFCMFTSLLSFGSRTSTAIKPLHNLPVMVITIISITILSKERRLQNKIDRKVN